MKNERFYYRIESPWHKMKWESYFDGLLCFTEARSVDTFDRQVNLPLLNQGEEYCGLWMFSCQKDAIDYLTSELSTRRVDGRLNDARAELCGRGDLGMYPFGITTRISVEGLEDYTVVPDLALIDLYPSACCAVGMFRPEAGWSIEVTSGALVPSITIPNNLIEIYFERRWHSKDKFSGKAFRCHLIKTDTVDGLINGLID